MPRSARSLIGQHAPSLVLTSSTGTPYRFKAGGRPIALFFFPAAGSVGCIRQSCSIRDSFNSKHIWSKNDCEVVGISGNTPEDNAAFVEQYRLPFTVLSDVDGVARKAYATGKGMFGYDGRVTYFIDSMGIVRDVFDSFINWNGHRKFVEAWLERVEVEAQPWSKFLDFSSVMTEYSPGTRMGDANPLIFGPNFGEKFTVEDDETEEGSIATSIGKSFLST